MPWKEMSVEQLAKSLGANVTEVREKQRLITMIVKVRKAKKMSQAVLAKKLGVSFDVIFSILTALGYDYRVTTRKAA
jgi:DNA-binding transcriptional regulator YiaG